VNMAQNPEILTITEVAFMLRCSKAHVCNVINGKVKGVTRLPAISMGRRKLVRREALEVWLSENDRTANVMILASCGSDAVGASKGANDA
jgi:excisionase family DNA binding protein